MTSTRPFLSVLFTLAASVLSAHSDGEHGHPQRPLRYTENKGQWDAAVLFRTGAIGATVFLERNGASWVKYAEGTSELVHDALSTPEASLDDKQFSGHAWRMRFHQPQGDLTIEATGVQMGYENFFLGNDPAQWKGNVKSFSEVLYRGVWPGVDVRYYSTEGHLKYDLLLAPGADHTKATFRYEGLDGLSVDEEGRLVMATSVGDVLELRPVAFYSDGAKESIECTYRIRNGMLQFDLPADLDVSRPVTIDPILIAATYSGATGASNYGHCATYDSNGNIYSGARNFGPTYPATAGAFQTAMGGGGTDISLSKYSPDGSALIWASYLGGSAGENPHSMVVNALGELCVLGSTGSSNYPVTPGAFDASLGGGTDIAITHISADGSSLLGSTFLGGSDSDGLNEFWDNYGEAYRGEIFVDGANNILIASVSSSADFPVTGGCFQATLGGGQDGVVVSLTPNCSSLNFSTYLGGSQPDNALGIRLAVNGDILITGQTESTDFPVTANGDLSTFAGGDRDGFVVRLAGDGSAMVAGTFFGTTESDRPYFLDTDLNGDVWIYGQTDGDIGMMPVGIYGIDNGPIFIAKFNGDLTDLLLTTTLGVGSQWGGGLTPVAFLVDVCDNIYISGYEPTAELPLTADALYTNGGFYLAAFSSDMDELLFGTYYGGSHVDGGTSRFDKNGIVYQGVCSGGQSMQSTAWAYAPTNQISWDIGVFKIDFGVAGVNAAGASAINTGCAPIQVDFSNASSGDTWTWDFGDGSPQVEAFEPSHLYTEPGDYTVTLIAQDSLACNLADTVYFQIQIGAQQPVEAALTWSQVEDCTEMRITAVNNSTGDPLDHIWQLSDGTEYTTDSISHVFDEAGSYEVILIAFDPTGCSQSDTIVSEITVAPLEFEFDIADRVLCQDGTVTLDAGQINGNYTWNTGATSPTLQVEDLGSYWVTISNAAGCIGTDTVQVIEAPTYDLAFQVTTCPGVTVPLRIPLDNAAAYLWDTGSQQRTIEVAGEVGTYAFAIIDQFGCVHQDSAKVELFDADVQLFAPNAFSPNGDGINDTFDLLGYGDRTLEMSIFNRWGEQLYATVSMDEPWDGTFKGTPVTNDVYVYVLTYTGMCTGNEEFKRTGHVTVIR